MCDKILPCGDICKCKCIDCKGGLIHIPCQKKCRKILFCGHKCNRKCGEPCFPCRIECDYKCIHGKCKKECGMLCNICNICKKDCIDSNNDNDEIKPKSIQLLCCNNISFLYMLI